MDSTLTRISAPFSLSHALLLINSQSLNSLSHSLSSRRISVGTILCSNSKLEISTLKSDVVFNESAFEADRLRLDSKARESMAETSKREMDAGIEDDPKAWKWVIRKRIWDLMEARNFAQNPRPVHHRIPNFVGASAAANNLARLEVFQNAGCVKVNPDSPQKQVRFLTLSGEKKLLTP